MRNCPNCGAHLAPFESGRCSSCGWHRPGITLQHVTADREPGCRWCAPAEALTHPCPCGTVVTATTPEDLRVRVLNHQADSPGPCGVRTDLEHDHHE